LVATTRHVIIPQIELNSQKGTKLISTVYIDVSVAQNGNETGNYISRGINIAA
jgi:hypothetical protein